jgi:subtilisin family serine protease
MACAGVLGASHTLDSISGMSMGSGIIGVNPWCSVVPIKIFSDDPEGCGEVPDSVLISGMDYAWQQDVDVVSCSWHMPLPTDGMEDAIERVVTLNKSFKGSPVIFSSGNTDKGPTGPVCFPARLSNCLAVGAIDVNNVRYGYSNYDSTLDLVAPSGEGDMWSLDQMGTLGGNDAYMTCPPGADNIDLICEFEGTSAACPQVAATASLIRAKDSMLTCSEIYEILKASAVPLGSGHPNDEYGYGRVDAFRAILSISHGDINNDGYVADLSDLSLLIAYLTVTPQPVIFPSAWLADWNCSGLVDLSDLSLCITWLTYHQSASGPVKPCFVF